MDANFISLITAPAAAPAKTPRAKMTPEEKEAAAAAKAAAKESKKADAAAKKAAQEEQAKIEKESKEAEMAAVLEAITILPVPEKVAPEKPEPVRASSIVKPTKMVWLIADRNPNARRKDVIALCEQMGIATHTARTQYQLWYSHHKASPITTTNQ